MSRRRYLSTEISVDSRVNQLSTFAALLFTWSLPHFADNCRLTPQNAVEVKWSVVPARREGVKEVEKAINEIIGVGLWGLDENEHFFIPAETFYKWQTYINAANRRKTPQIAASPSPSLSPSLKEDKSREPKKQATTFPDNFTVSKLAVDLALANSWDHPQDHLDAFRDHHLAHGSKFVDWSRAFMTWLRRADEFKHRGGYGPQPKETSADRLRQRTKETLTRGLDDKENL